MFRRCHRFGQLIDFSTRIWPLLQVNYGLLYLPSCKAHGAHQLSIRRLYSRIVLIPRFHPQNPIERQLVFGIPLRPHGEDSQRQLSGMRNLRCQSASPVHRYPLWGYALRRIQCE